MPLDAARCRSMPLDDGRRVGFPQTQNKLAHPKIKIATFYSKLKIRKSRARGTHLPCPECWGILIHYLNSRPTVIPPLLERGGIPCVEGFFNLWY